MEEADAPAPLPPPPPPPSSSQQSPSSYGNQEGEAAAAAMREEDEEDEDGGLPLGREDPVMKEIPVFLSTELAQQLHVIQYPNRPFYRPYEPPAAARVKPVNKLLELEYDLPLSSEHLDEEAPRHLRLERIKVQSSYLDPMTTYAVGTMRGDALHLTPLAGIYQMRASCEHVDAATEEDGVEGLLAEDEDSEAEEGAGGARGRAGGAASSPATGAAQAPVKLQHIEYKKRESEKAAAARRTSYAYKRQQEEAEPWTELAIYPQGSHASAQDWARLQCPPESRGRPIRFRGGSGVYVDLYRKEMARVREEEARAGGRGSAAAAGGGGGGQGLGGGRDGEVTVVADDKAAVLAGLGEGHGGVGVGGGPGGHRVPIQQLAGAEQVAAVFERAHVVSFDMVLALANPNALATAAAALASGRDPALPLLEQVMKHAVLVRGNWVRKSSLCGLPPRLAAARDALLLLLVRYGGVNRMQLAQAAGLGDEEVLALLQPLARLDKDRRMWVPASPDDAGFLHRYPEAVAQQAKAWRDREKDREVGAILAAVGAPDCPFPGPVEGGVEGAAVVGEAGVGGGKGGGGKGRRKG